MTSRSMEVYPHDSLTQDSRVRLTARISSAAYDAIIECQRQHRKQTGKVLRLWKVIDSAVLTYAKTNGIELRS